MDSHVAQRVAKKVSGKVLLAACLALPLAGAGCTVRAYDRGYREHERVYVDVAPPPARVEVIPARPSAEHVWVGGYWAWRGGRHEWVSGHYTLAPHRGGRWEPGHWDRDHGRYYWIEGRWR